MGGETKSKRGGGVMNPTVTELIGSLVIGLKYLGMEANAPIKWWQKSLLIWLLGKRHLCAPLGYAQHEVFRRQNT